MDGLSIKKRPRHTTWAMVIIAVIGIGMLSFLLWPWHSPQPRRLAATPHKAVAATPKPQPKPKVIGTFTGDGFRALYEQHLYPHTEKITTPPPITGNDAADAHLQTIAQARGYKLRSLATGPFRTVDDLPLQPAAAAAWQVLKTTAQEEGINLRLVAGYRSFDDQQALFMRALTTASIPVSAIAGGANDAALNTIMQTISIPGYSKHHTGYTVDIGCNNTPGTFVTTPCFQWLSLNNYANTKKTGWMPSYPPSSGEQGPMPEPWEYVWMGVDALTREGS